MSDTPIKMNFPDASVVAAEDDVSSTRSLSVEERGQLLIAACRAAATIEQGRKQSGLPLSSPAPWPPSTWQFLRKWASHV